MIFIQLLKIVQIKITELDKTTHSYYGKNMEMVWQER